MSPSRASSRPTSTGDRPAPRRAELWLAELDKPRPVVVLHRDVAGRTLNALLVAPLTTTIRGIPTEVRLGPADGVDRDCVASLDNLTLVPVAYLLHRLGAVPATRMQELCDALAIAVDCNRRPR